MVFTALPLVGVDEEGHLEENKAPSTGVNVNVGLTAELE
jgi:hypothetical protein